MEDLSWLGRVKVFLRAQSTFVRVLALVLLSIAAGFVVRFNGALAVLVWLVLAVSIIAALVWLFIGLLRNSKRSNLFVKIGVAAALTFVMSLGSLGAHALGTTLATTAAPYSAEEIADQERRAAERAEREAQEVAEKAEREAQEAAEEAEREAQEAAEKAEKASEAAAEKAEREAQEAAEKAEKASEAAAEKAEKERRNAAEKANKDAAAKASERSQKSAASASRDQSPEPQSSTSSSPWWWPFGQGASAKNDGFLRACLSLKNMTGYMDLRYAFYDENKEENFRIWTAGLSRSESQAVRDFFEPYDTVWVNRVAYLMALDGSPPSSQEWLDIQMMCVTNGVDLEFPMSVY
jgi:outer membrane biosynthesis protein TonB